MKNKALSERSMGNEQVVEHSLGEIRTFIDELKNGTRKYRTVASLGGQITEAYRGRCVLELLQNAHDALGDVPGGEPGLITFSLLTAPEPVLFIANSGRPFERKDFKGLCQLGQSPKDPNKSVGNKGLGFRSVLEVASGPEIWSTPSIEGGASYVFRFDPGIGDEMAAAIGALNKEGLDARWPFDRSVPLVDWQGDQLAQYRKRLVTGRVDGPNEARQFLSPYDFPLPIEGSRAEVDELLRDGHVTVIRLPLDGGSGGSVADAVASVKEQLESLLDISTTLFLPHMKALVVNIDGERSMVRRTVNAREPDESGSIHRQSVDISRIGPDQDKDVTGRFRVWTRVLGGTADPEWAARIRASVQHLPNKWPNVDRAEIGVAVREGPEPDSGRFVIFLPTTMATGTGAHINAPFFGSLDRRRFELKDTYNTLLLECVLDLCLDAVNDLLNGEAEEVLGRAVVDILGAWQGVEGTGRDLLELAHERANVQGWDLEERALVLCDNGWALAAKARSMPLVPDGIVIGPADWRWAAAFSVVSSALDRREPGVKALIEGLKGNLSPADGEWSRTVERLAGQVRSRDVDSTWDGFLTSVLQVLPLRLRARPRLGTSDALASSKFLPDQDGRLISVSDDVKLFFQPMRGFDDAAELVHTIPGPLKDRIAFLHAGIRTHTEGSQPRRTDTYNFLNERFAVGFVREDIVRDVVLAAIPPLPAAFGSSEAKLCSELFNWTIRLLPEKPSEALLSLLSDLPVACHGGWRSVDEAVFGRCWPGSSGDALWELAEEFGDPVGKRLRDKALLPPGDPRWGLDVQQHGDLFKRMGVADGLRLSRVNTVNFWMHIPGYEIPEEAPVGIDQKVWDGWRAFVGEESRPRHRGWFEYSLEDIYWLHELDGAEALTRRGRQALSRLVLDSMGCWPEEWQLANIRKVHGERTRWSITSPLKYWLSTHPWLADGSGAEQALSVRWHVPTSLLQGHQDRYRHLAAADARRVTSTRGGPGLGRYAQGAGTQRLPNGKREYRTGASQRAGGSVAHATGARGTV